MEPGSPSSGRLDGAGAGSEDASAVVCNDDHEGGLPPKPDDSPPDTTALPTLLVTSHSSGPRRLYDLEEGNLCVSRRDTDEHGVLEQFRPALAPPGTIPLVPGTDGRAGDERDARGSNGLDNRHDDRAGKRGTAPVSFRPEDSVIPGGFGYPGVLPPRGLGDSGEPRGREQQERFGKSMSVKSALGGRGTSSPARPPSTFTDSQASIRPQMSTLAPQFDLSELVVHLPSLATHDIPATPPVVWF